jgi:hypothetical protein
MERTYLLGLKKMENETLLTENGIWDGSIVMLSFKANNARTPSDSLLLSVLKPTWLEPR